MSELRTLSVDNKKNRLLPLYIEHILMDSYELYEEKKRACAEHVLLFCAGGRLQVKADEHIFLLDENMLIFVEPGQSISCYASEKPAKLAVIVYGGCGVAGAREYLEFSAHECFHFSLDNFTSALQRIVRHLQMENFYLASIAFERLLIEIIYTRDSRETGENIEILKNYIEMNFCENLDDQELAELYGTSVSYLCRSFKARYHMTPMAYVNELRIDQACRLLTTGKMRVSEIAKSCGYSSMEYFCYVFKKRMNCTPLQYRKNETL